MVKKAGFVIILLIVLWGTACDENDNPIETTGTVEGLSLLGLVNNRTLNYFQLDTITTIPDFEMEIDSSYLTIAISGSGNNWVLKNNEDPLINLLISNHYVLQNGFWKDNGESDSLCYFPLPAVVMMRAFQSTRTWDDLTPRLVTDSGDIRYPFYNCYFGFYFEKKYTGTETLTLTKGEFKTYRFDVNLFFNPSDSLPVATATEYYAPSIGLVRINFSGQGLKRNIYLVNYH